MQVVIDSESISYKADNVFLAYGGDESVYLVLNEDGGIVDVPGAPGASFRVTSAVPAGGTGRSIDNMKVTPTTGAGYVVGKFYWIGVESWTSPSTSHGWHFYGPFQVVAADTAQTGDAYTRLGAPTGASIAADIARIAKFLQAGRR